MIFISAGHYPSAPGARWHRFVEHDEAMIWAKELVDSVSTAMLVPSGVLRSKVNFINERIMNGDIAIEIHFNYATDENNNPIGKGSETLYHPDCEQSKELAQLCQNSLADIFPPDRGAKEGWYRADKSRGPDFFLADTKCPAIIIAPEFVHRAEIIHSGKEAAIMNLANELKINYE